MVIFEKEAFIIRVKTGIMPTDNWVYTCTDIIDALTDVSTDLRNEHTYYYLLQLLKEMQPSEAQAQKMLPQ